MGVGGAHDMNTALACSFSKAQAIGMFPLHGHDTSNTSGGPFATHELGQKTTSHTMSAVCLRLWRRCKQARRQRQRQGEVGKKTREGGSASLGWGRSDMQHGSCLLKRGTKA